MRRSIAVLLVGFLVASTTAGGQNPTGETPVNRQRDSVAVIAVVSRFHDALAAGDTGTVQALLAPDLSVLESGSVESRAEYFTHHLGADIEFAKAVSSPRTLVSYKRDGNTAWLVSTSSAQGSFRGRGVNSVGAELMILTKSALGWQIRAIHWSSRRRT